MDMINREIDGLTYVRDFLTQEEHDKLVSIIDSNQLYVNYSDMEDKNHTVTDTDKDITIKFYNL